METFKDVGPNLKSFFYHVSEPKELGLLRGVVVLLHGSEEHGGRYEKFGQSLVNNGYALYAIDHIGHGKTTMGDKDLVGKWKNTGKKNDFYLSTYNAYYLVDIIRKKHPGKPVYLLGHDFGGTMVQYMLAKFPDAFDGVIVSGCGTPTGKDKWIFLKSFVKKILLFDEMKSKGTFRKRKSYLNMHFRPTRTKYDWLNSIPEEVDAFIKDPMSGFVADIGYYYYLYRYIVTTPSCIRFKKINKSLPILFVSGEDDYVTHRGKTTRKLMEFYNRKGFVNTEFKTYSGARHDVLMDCSREQIAEDIARWIDKNSCIEEPQQKVVYPQKETVEIKAITLGSVKPSVEPQKVVFAEEEPDDELKLSNELKNKGE